MLKAETPIMATGGGEEEHGFTILWRIKNLICYQRRVHGFEIMSPCFSCDLGFFYMILYPRGYDRIEGDENVHIQLCTRFSSQKLDCKFSLMSCDGSPLVTRTGRHTMATPFEFIDASNFATHEEVFMTKKSEFLPFNTLTVRCQIWSFVEKLPCAEFFSGWSHLQFVENCLLWSILGFGGSNFVLHKTLLLGLYFRSWTVSLQLKCSLVGDSLQNSQLDIKVTAHQIIRECLVTLKVSVLGNGQEVIRLKEREHYFRNSRGNSIWKVPIFKLKEELPEVMSVLSCDKSLHLRFHLTAVSKCVPGSIDSAYIKTWDLEQDTAPILFPFTERSCQTVKQTGVTSVDVLLEDFHALYREQKFSDFKLRSGEVSFPVHKVVLCARSPIFRIMFSSGMMESNSNSLEVPDLDADTLDQLLTFLYKGSVDPRLTLDSAAKLYYAADKYQVDSLKSVCSSIIKFHMCISNSSDILELADRHQDSNLLLFVYKFILRHLEDVMLSDEWEKFLDCNPVLGEKSTNLLIEIFLKRSKRTE